MIDFLLILITGFSLISFLVVLYNFVTNPSVKPKNIERSDIKISVLIPARNEENNIAGCLDSVLNQTYKADEIIVIDDFSTDNTFNIIENYSENYSHVKIFKNETLPENWLGKNWACYNLYLKSKNDYLLFLDADVRLENKTLESFAYLINNYNPDLISIFPTQTATTFGEKLIVPLMNWLLLSFLPLKKVYDSKSVSFSAANGQFMFFKKEAYIKIGTHRAVANKIVEDMELVRSIKKNNLKALTLLGGNLVNCRMYGSFKESLNGFTKNFYGGFNINPFAFIFLLLTFVTVFLLPFAFIFFDWNFIYPIIVIIVSRVLISILSKKAVLINLILHIPQMLLMFLIGIRSVYYQYSKKIVWKERKII